MLGQTISHYRIVEKLGEGGMGVVFKAEDLKLGRAVALKFLPSHLLGSEEHKARFLHEARAAALLDHANICTVYEIDEVDGQTFLAMACLEGQTLKQKIAARPLPLQEALDIALQIGKGLQAAHEKGIVHRDIKPANIMITPQGQVKIMDFGLAQLSDRTKLTASGIKLGTPAYMSPEQTGGKAADRRSDIWSLGVVLYEMISGRVPFPGEAEAAVAYAILHTEPEPLTALRSGLPVALDRIVGKLLAKAPADRYQHVDEILVDLRRLTTDVRSGKTLEHAAAAFPDIDAVSKGKLLVPWALAAVLTLALLVILWNQSRPASLGRSVAPLRRFAIEAQGIPTSAAISPDGRQIAFTAMGENAGLWIHDLREGRARHITGTEAARSPFWSPDSRSVGFFAEMELRTIRLDGGLSSRVCEVLNHMDGASWSPDGESIVFSSGQDHQLYEVPARGGSPVLVVKRDQLAGRELRDARLYFPHFLPSKIGKKILLYAYHRGSERTLVIRDLETGRSDVVGSGTRPFYSSSGHLVYQAPSEGPHLWAMPFSLQTLQVAGESLRVAENASFPSISSDGTLVYVDATADSSTRLVWVDRKGNLIEELGLTVPAMGAPTLSSDGHRVLYWAREAANTDVWVYDIVRQTRTRLTTAPAADILPVWSPTGAQVAFSSDRSETNYDIYVCRTDGGGEETRIHAGRDRETVSDWSRDGRYMLYETLRDSDPGDLWYLERSANGGTWEPHLFLQTPFREAGAKISPNGRYAAYVSNESGRNEIYVLPFPNAHRGPRVTVSANGGTKHRWSRDGGELFYVDGEDTMVEVKVSTDTEFTLGTATRLFQHPGLTWEGDSAPYDVTVDEQRFLLAELIAEVGTAKSMIRVVQSWPEEPQDREQD